MKQYNGTLATFLSSLRGNPDATCAFADCYTISIMTPANAAQTPYFQNTATGNYTNFYFTSADVNVSDTVNLYLANSVLVSGLKYKSTTGVDVDQQTINISARPTDTVSLVINGSSTNQYSGLPWLQAIRNGILDGALIQRKRVFMDSWATMNYQGDVILFSGRVSDIHSIGRTSAEVTVDSDLTLLNIQMPRNMFSPQCVHVLYDSGCQVPRSPMSGTVASGSTINTIIWPYSSSDYAQGAIYFETGVNTGASRTISSGSSSALALAYPLENTPAVGDTFSVVLGCDHTMATCQNRFNNLTNFRGFPFVPNAMTAFQG